MALSGRELAHRCHFALATAVAAGRVIGLAVAIMLMAGPAPARERVGEQSAASAQAALSVLRLAGSPKVEATAAPGDDVVVAPVRYVYTGALVNTVRTCNMLPPTCASIPAGTPMFGIPMSFPTGVAPHPNLMWCAAMGGPTATDLAARWRIVCLPVMAGWVRWLDVRSDLFPASLSISINGDVATTPIIQDKPQDIPLPLTAAVRFIGWSGDGADIQLSVRQPDSRTLLGAHDSGDHRLVTIHLGCGKDGACHLGSFDGEFAMRRGSDGKSAVIEIVKPFPGAAAFQK